MSKDVEYDWNESKIIDDVEFQDEDAKLFQKLLNNKEDKAEEGSISSMEVGQIFSGTIVELTPDFVVVDVGLKSEGLIPVNEFNNPKELILGNEIEVFLDRTEGEDGQIVLSR
ncbi:MAG: S1 RNA-binding domain-containing protein, partial [Simkaniaceae bacterium]